MAKKTHKELLHEQAALLTKKKPGDQWTVPDDNTRRAALKAAASLKLAGRIEFKITTLRNADETYTIIAVK